MSITPTWACSTSPLYPQLADKLGLPVDHGSMLANVVAGGPADRAGLRAGKDEVRFQGVLVPSNGDIVVAVDGKDVKLEDDLGRLLEAYGPGDTVTLSVLRGKDRRDVRVKLGSRPAESVGAAARCSLPRALLQPVAVGTKSLPTTRTSSAAISSKRSARSQSP